jgi:glucose/arabinose dehydrogenase
MAISFCKQIFLAVFFSLIVGMIFSPKVSAQRIDYKTVDIATELNVPWEMRWGYDNWIWFTERAGRFGKVNPETKERKLLLFETDVYSLSERGMLGFDFHPDFPDSPYIYISYTYQDSTHFPDTVMNFEKVVRYRYTPDTLIDRVTLFDGIHAYIWHNGSRVKFGPDRKLYISTGETYDQPWLSQQDTSPNGKILRLNPDGSIPNDNPWKGSPVWTKGHRNPQGLVFGPDGTLYSSEHGNASDDEVNIIHRGRNYGWPLVEGYADRDDEKQPFIDSNVVEPIAAWTPTLAVTGMEYYDNDRFPEWKNSFLLMTLKDESLWHLKLDSTRTKIIAQERYHIRLSIGDTGIFAGRLRDVCFSPDGRIFVSTSNIWSVEWNPDRIFEIIRTGRSGVFEKEKSRFEFSVNPNPAHDKITVSGFPQGRSEIELTDLVGRTITRRSVGAASGASVEIPCRHLAAGMYYICIFHANEVVTRPVFIQ